MRKPRRGLWLLFAGAILLLAASAAFAARTVTEDEVARRIICQCGCGKVLSICEMTGWAVPAKELIARKAAQGLSADAIVQYFVDEYGEKILAAPPKRGFFLTAWLTPFAAILLGGTFIVILLMHWVRRGEEEESTLAIAPLTLRERKLADRFEAEVDDEG